MNAFWNSFETLLGLGVEPRDLTFVQISLRGIIVFLVTLVAVRLGHKRSLSRKTPFDAVLLVILAAVLSRAINGSAAFFATLGGGVVLVVLHRLFAFLAFDLFIGRWVYLDSCQCAVSAWLMAPVLFFVLMLGPIGFLLYLAVRTFYQPWVVRYNKRTAGGYD